MESRCSLAAYLEDKREGDGFMTRGRIGVRVRVSVMFSAVDGGWDMGKGREERDTFTTDGKKQCHKWRERLCLSVGKPSNISFSKLAD